MTNSSEKFCLKWNDFQKNIVSSYHDLRKETDFCDVTLVCEEDKYIEAHKIILTACSPVFSTILKRNKHSHPLIYMRGLKAKDMVAIVDFIYYGEANIYEDDLGGFLALAEELQLKGLAKALDKPLDLYQDQFEEPKQSPSQHKLISGQGEYHYKHQTSEESDIKIVSNFEDHVDADKLVLPLNTNKQDLKAHLDSMMVKAEYGEIKYTCRVCGKADKIRSHMREHIETHIGGLSFPCNLCGKVSRTSHCLRDHVRRYHAQ